MWDNVLEQTFVWSADQMMIYFPLALETRDQHKKYKLIVILRPHLAEEQREKQKHLPGIFHTVTPVTRKQITHSLQH